MPIKKDKSTKAQIGCIFAGALIFVLFFAGFSYILVRTSGSYGYDQGYNKGKEQGLKIGYQLRKAEEALQLSKDIAEIDSMAKVINDIK